MKKKFILTNVFFIFLSLVFFFLTSSYVIKNENKKSFEKEMKSDIYTISVVFDGSNMEETCSIFSSSSKKRVTIIAHDGSVVKDSYQDASTYDNHLERDEIQHLGKIVYRYSASLKTQMAYLAIEDDGYYIRFSTPYQTAYMINQKFLIYGSILLVSLSILSIFASHQIVNHSLKPLKKEIVDFSKIVGEETIYEGDSLEVLSLQIEKVQEMLKDKMNQIEEEKMKNAYILENMSQGFLLFNENLEAIEVNSVAKSIFPFASIGAHYLYFIRDYALQKKIEEVYQTHEQDTYDLHVDLRSYHVILSYFPYQEGETQKEGFTLFFFDNTKEEQMKEMKQDFFANASHELKSPLTSIIGYQQMMEQGILSEEEEKKEAIHKTIEEAKRMNQILQDMLELSALESGKIGKEEMIDMEELMKSVLSRYKMQIDEKKLQIETSFSSFPIRIVRKEGESLLANLLENAIKYTPKEGKITLELIKEKRMFRIVDTGIGIAKENQERVFERFFQVDRSHSKKVEGTGLGLAIVKHICLLYHIQISLSSTLGKGTTIELVFNENMQ